MHCYGNAVYLHELWTLSVASVRYVVLPKEKNREFVHFNSKNEYFKHENGISYRFTMYMYLQCFINSCKYLQSVTYV